MSDDASTHHTSPGAAGEPSSIATLTQPQPDVTLCTVTNKVHSATASTLSDALATAQQDRNAHLVIDLSAITSLDSTGFFTLLKARHIHNLDHRGHLALVVTPGFHGIPEIYAVALKVSFDLHHTLASALQACTNTDHDQPPQ